MINILLTGVGGQGTVLAAKVLAQASHSRGWQVRTAETIGMSQRGGSVISYVRMADKGETVYAPLVATTTANLIIAFEPAEAARVLPYLAPDGTMITVRTPVQPTTVALSDKVYRADDVIAAIKDSMQEGQTLVSVDDDALIASIGNRKVLNIALLAVALKSGSIDLGLDDLRDAVRACVKPQFVDMNLGAIDIVENN